MLLNDEAGCAGADTAGELAPICFGCARIGHLARSYILPAATFEAGEWQCLERRSRGHVADYAGKPASEAPLTLGAQIGVSAFATAQTGGRE
jgi:hypothetical protein